MKYLVSLSVVLFLSHSFFAQRDEAIRDTVVNGKLFHVIMYNQSNHPACVGSYMPNTFIRTGEWDYFFDDGKICSQTYFKLDDKTGIWIYYDEQGNITKEMKPCKKRHSFIDYYVNANDDDRIMRPIYQNAQQNKNACVLYSHGSEPLEYDEKLYQYKVNLMMYNMSLSEGDNTYYYKNVLHRKHKPVKSIKKTY